MKLAKRCQNNQKTQPKTQAFGSGFRGVSCVAFLTCFISVLSVLILSHNTSAATSTITLSIVDGISVNVLPSGNGTFASSSGTNNISIKTTHATGYTLGIKAGTSGSNALINTNDSSKTIPSITSSISESTYSSSSTYNNTWGFKPSKLNSASNSNYIAAPTSTSTPTILDKTTTANPSTNNNYTITLGTRINNSQAPGTYANTFIITAIVNPTPYSITYNKNTTDTVTNMPSNVSTETYDETVTISNQVPTRDGFNFKGWCTVQTADGSTCTGTTYNPDGGGTNLTWTLDQTSSSNSLTLYVMWESSRIYMQDATMADCGKTMYDKRDSGTETAYTTALIGGQCWMTTNLNLAGGTALSADDTDVTSAYISSFTTSNNLTKTGNTIVLPPSTTDSGFDTGNYSYVANSGNASSNCSNAPGCYSYYSWDAATLGSGRTIATDNTNAEQSICPKGWHLPTTYDGNPNDSTDFRKLMIALGGSAEVQTYNDSSTPTGATMHNSLVASPNNFLLAGAYRYSSFGRGGSYGNYWSSTSYSRNSSALSLHFNSSRVGSADYDNRYVGYSVRCVLDKTMQDVGSWESQVGAGGETTAVDRRDGEKYTVARLSDGNLWMTRNLRFEGAELKVGETNVTSNRTISPYGALTSGNSMTEPRKQYDNNTDYGAYYNFCAASAQTVCNDTTQADATQDICPAGWKLPTQAQLNALPSKESHFTTSSSLAGDYAYGSLHNAGTGGYWWASTAYSAKDQRNLYYTTDTGSWTILYGRKHFGFTIRCVRAS